MMIKVWIDYYKQWYGTSLFTRLFPDCCNNEITHRLDVWFICWVFIWWMNRCCVWHESHIFHFDFAFSFSLLHFFTSHSQIEMEVFINTTAGKVFKCLESLWWVYHYCLGLFTSTDNFWLWLNSWPIVVCKKGII